MARLATATGDLALQDKAYIVAEHAMGRASKQAYGQAGIVNSCVLVLEPLKLVIIESSDNPSLVPVANRNPDPRRVDLIVPLGDAAPGLPGGLVPTTERPGAYYCTGQVCLPVVTEPEELERLLRRKSG